MRWVIQNLAAAEAGSPASRLLQIGVFTSVIVKIVPTLCVGTQAGTLRLQQPATSNQQPATSNQQPTTQSVGLALAEYFSGLTA
jgi:hypothetical protein